MNYGSNDESKKDDQNLTEGVSSELLGVLPSNIGFENNYTNVREAYDWALTDLEENAVELSLPIDTLISLHAYRFRELHSESELFSSSKILFLLVFRTIFDNRNNQYAYNKIKHFSQRVSRSYWSIIFRKHFRHW